MNTITRRGFLGRATIAVAGLLLPWKPRATLAAQPTSGVPILGCVNDMGPKANLSLGDLLRIVKNTPGPVPLVDARHRWDERAPVIGEVTGIRLEGRRIVGDLKFADGHSHLAERPRLSSSVWLRQQKLDEVALLAADDEPMWK